MSDTTTDPKTARAFDLAGAGITAVANPVTLGPAILRSSDTAVDVSFDGGGSFLPLLNAMSGVRVIPDAAASIVEDDVAHGLTLVCTSAAAVTLTASDLGGYRSCAVLQAGAGQVTIAADTGATLVSDKAAPSFATAREGAMLTLTFTGTGTVYVVGNTA